jgi:hypothetical protein
MKVSYVCFAALLIACLAVPFASAGGQQKAMTQQQMMDQMMKYSTPVKEHEYLKKYVGAWDVEVKSWTQPGAAPTVEKAKMKGEVIFGGRYVKCGFDGTMMGQPFNGLQVIGYDLYQKKYVTFWIDSMSTHFSLTSGTIDPMGKALTETGIWPDAMTAGTRKVKIVTTWLADGKFRYDMFMVGPDGKEAKTMEIVYTRQMM